MCKQFFIVLTNTTFNETCHVKLLSLNSNVCGGGRVKCVKFLCKFLFRVISKCAYWKSKIFGIIVSSHRLSRPNFTVERKFNRNASNPETYYNHKTSKHTNVQKLYLPHFQPDIFISIHYLQTFQMNRVRKNRRKKIHHEIFKFICTRS